MRVQEKEDLLTVEKQSTYRQIVGQMNWAVHITRPDMAVELIDPSTKLKQTPVGNLSRTVKQSTDGNMWDIISKTKQTCQMHLCNNTNNRTESTAAYVVWLANNRGKCCHLACHTYTLKRVVRSTIAAMTPSLQDCFECRYNYRQMLADIMKLQRNTMPMIAYVVNKSVITFYQVSLWQAPAGRYNSPPWFFV